MFHDTLVPFAESRIITMKLKRFYNKKVNIVTKEGIAFSGVVTEYFYPEENESGKGAS